MVMYQAVKSFEVVQFLPELCLIIEVSFQQLLDSELVTVKFYLDASCQPWVKAQNE